MTGHFLILADEVVATPTPTPTPYPDYLQYHYLTNYFSGELEFWSVLNMFLACGLALIVLFSILYWGYRRNKKAK